MESNELIKILSAKLTDDAIQRTKKADTKRGYDTDGYGYQFVVDRFNETLGESWGYSYRILREAEGSYKSGQTFYDITVEVSIWVNDKDKPRSCVGGHVAALYSDALKGAITNGFKKTAAFWGVGRDAYAGTLDDDYAPLPDKMENVQNAKEINTATQSRQPDMTERLSRLPENIKEGMRALSLTVNQVKAICIRAQWDNDAISTELNRLADQGAA